MPQTGAPGAPSGDSLHVVGTVHGGAPNDHGDPTFPPPPSRRVAALLALFAALTALAVSVGLRLGAEIPTLAELALGRVVQLLPLQLFEWGIRTLGGWAKPLLFLTLLAVQTVLLALVGYGWLRHARRRQGAWLAGLVAATFGLGTLCTLWLIGYGTSSVGQTVGAATVAVSALVVCAAWALGLLLARWTASYTSRATAPTGRRRFLVAGGVWAVLLAASIGGSGWALLQRISITSLRLDSRRTPAITPIPEFYLVSKNVLDPVVNAEEWRLTVEGAVERPMTFTLDELRALPATEQFATMECISNPVGGRLISTTLWRGVRLSEVLDRAGVRADAQDVVTVCADGYTESLELERATAPDVLLVYEMGGEPLTSKHGAPLRLQVPGRYGLKSSKWVERIRPTSENFLGYWQQESNWTDIGEVHTECRIDNLPGGRVRLGDATITGVAYTGLRGVSKVEVSTDGGEAWSPALLDPTLGPLTWRLWTFVWRPVAPGEYTLVARAFDADCAPQEEAGQGALGVRPPGAVEVVHGSIGLHRLNVTVTEGDA